MELIAIREYKFSESARACMICCKDNLFVVVRADHCLFITSPKHEIGKVPLTLYIHDLSNKFGYAKELLYQERIGVSIEEIPYRVVDEDTCYRTHHECISRSLRVDTSKYICSWSDRVFEQTKKEPTRTTVLIKLDINTYAMLRDDNDIKYLTECGDSLITFDSDGFITSSTASNIANTYTLLGKFALREYVTYCPPKEPTLIQRFVIGSTFRKYRKWEETKGGFNYA